MALGFDALSELPLSSLPVSAPAGISVDGALINDEGIVTASVTSVIGVTASLINDDGIVASASSPVIGVTASVVNDDGIATADVSASAVATVTSSTINDDGIVTANVSPAIGITSSVINDDGIVTGVVTPQAAGITVTGNIINDDGVVTANVIVTGEPQANTLGGVIATGNYYYRQRSEPLRVKKTRAKLAKDETQAQTEQNNLNKPTIYNTQAVAAVKDARKRLFDAESAVKQAEDDLNLANLRLIAYLEAAEMEIQAEDAEIMRIIAELL
jgi:hypothetical protein